MIQKLSVSLRLKIGIGEKIMANNEFRKLPVGIQSFNVIREEGYLYVDKTDIIWNLANNGRQYNFLIRPRRFGKSVLVDTDRKSTRLNSSHKVQSRMPSSA